MALVLVNEDGTGMSDANSYAAVADGDAYHDGHLYAAAWTAATTQNKEKALVMATRLIDEFFLFNGLRRSTAQALQWPRRDCPDPDSGEAFPETSIPRPVVNATSELARALLLTDRTADPDGEGLKTWQIVGEFAFEFDKADRRQALTVRVQAMLSKLGTFCGHRSGVAKLTRA
jgi:hypothetical protein